MRPCGIATPWPRPVLPSFSRAVRPLKMSVADSAPAPLASRRLSSSSDFFLLVTAMPAATRSALRMALSFIGSPEMNRGPGPAGAALSRYCGSAVSLVDVLGVVVPRLFLVLAGLAVQLVGQQVDGRVHVLVDRLRVEVGPSRVDRRLRLVPQLLDREHHAGADQVAEVPFQPGDLFRNVGFQCVGEREVMSSDVQIHCALPPRSDPADSGSGESFGCQDTALRSWDGGMPSASRYLATVRRATRMPSLSSRSARVLSDSGSSGGSAVTRRLIMAWMAVAEQVPPCTVCTWLEKKNLSS